MLSGQGVDVDTDNLFRHVTNAYQDSQKPGFFEGISNVFKSIFGMQDSYADKTELNAESQKLATSISGNVVTKYVDEHSGYTAFKQKALDTELTELKYSNVESYPILPRADIIVPSEEAIDSYLRAKHKIFLEKGKWPKMGMAGLKLYTIGYEAEKFELQNPKIAGGISYSADMAGKFFELMADGIIDGVKWTAKNLVGGAREVGGAFKKLMKFYLLYGDHEVLDNEDLGITALERYEYREQYLKDLAKEDPEMQKKYPEMQKKCSEFIERNYNKLLEEIMEDALPEQFKGLRVLDGAFNLAAAGGLIKGVAKSALNPAKLAQKLKPSSVPAAATTTEVSAAKEAGAAATKIADDVAGSGKFADDAVKFESVVGDFHTVFDDYGSYKLTKGVSAETKEFFKRYSDKLGGFAEGAVLSDTEINMVTKKVFQYNEAPFTLGSVVTKFDTKSGMKFVRVTGPNAQGIGNWVMLWEDIKGLTPVQIAEKYALPRTPTHFVEVLPDPGYPMWAGLTAPNFGKKGGGTQFFFAFKMNRKEKVFESWFSTPKKLP